MDFIHEWKSKTLDPEQVFGGVLIAKKISLAHTMYSFDQQCYQMKLVLWPFVDFSDRKLSKNIQLEIIVCIAVR